MGGGRQWVEERGEWRREMGYNKRRTRRGVGDDWYRRGQRDMINREEEEDEEEEDEDAKEEEEEEEYARGR